MDLIKKLLVAGLITAAAGGGYILSDTGEVYTGVEFPLGDEYAVYDTSSPCYQDELTMQIGTFHQVVGATNYKPTLNFSGSEALLEIQRKPSCPPLQYGTGALLEDLKKINWFDVPQTGTGA